jgi:Male gamete fusion factor
MVYSADWWEAYNVHESMLDFRVTVSINATDSNTTSLQLQPSSPRGRSADGAVGASLTGDLLPYSAFPVLSSKYLLMPSLGSVQTLDPNKWMVLDPSMLTFDGTECNKIGVGFNAFRWVALAHCKQLVLRLTLLSGQRGPSCAMPVLCGTVSGCSKTAHDSGSSGMTWI